MRWELSGFGMARQRVTDCMLGLWSRTGPGYLVLAFQYLLGKSVVTRSLVPYWSRISGVGYPGSPRRVGDIFT